MPIDDHDPTDPTRDPWIRHHETTVYSNPWMQVIEYAVTRPDGAAGIYGIVRPKQLAVGVLPLDADGQVWLVGQWRFPLARYSWEMPEGGGGFDEDPAAAAARELREEAGLRAERVQPVLRMHLSNSLTDELAWCFLATGLHPVAAEPDPTEVLGVRRVPFAMAYRAALAGEITDSLTVATLLRVRLMAVEGDLPADLAAMVRAGDRG